MDILHFIANFFEGLFLCNCIPHLACGLRGESFPTPFARPRGVGLSSPLLNFLWGTLNFIIGMLLVSYFPVVIGINIEAALFMAGFIIIGVCLSRHFENVRRNH